MLGSADNRTIEEDNSSSSFGTTNSNNHSDEMISKLIQQAALFQQPNSLITTNSQPSSSSKFDLSDTNNMIHDCFFTPTTSNTGGEMSSSSNFDSFLMSFGASSSTNTSKNNVASSINVNNLSEQQQPSSTALLHNTSNHHHLHHNNQMLFSSSATSNGGASSSQPCALLPNNQHNTRGNNTLSDDDAMMISEVFTSPVQLQSGTGLSISKEKRKSNNSQTNNSVGDLHSYLTQSSQTNVSGNNTTNNNQQHSNNNNNNNNMDDQSQQQQQQQQSEEQSSTPGSNLHPIACTRCRERHKRCDRKLPQCSYCEKQGLPCLYTTPKKQRRVYQRAVPVPAGNDVSSITMVTGGGSSGSFFTSSRTSIAGPNGLLAPRRGSVDSTFSNISTTTSGGISTTSSTAGTTNSGSSGNETETANAFEIFTFRWQAGGTAPNTKSDKKRKSSCESSLNVQKRNSVTKLSPSKQNISHAFDNSSVQPDQFENYSFPKKAKKSTKKSSVPIAQSSNSQSVMIDNQTNNSSTFNQDNQSIYFNHNSNNMDAINSSISSIISHGLMMNQQKDITQDHLNMLGTSNQNVPTMLLNLDNSLLFGNQNMSYNSTQNLIMNASVFRKSNFDFYFRYISLGYSWVPQEVFDSVLFGTEAMSSVFGNDIMSLLYAVHAITALVMGNSVEAEMAYHKSELLLPPLPDNSLSSLLNNGSLTINSTHSVARNLVLAHYLFSVGNLTSSKRYMRLADGVLSKYSPNYLSQSFINCMASSDEEDAGGLTHECSIFAKVPNQIMLLMKYRVYIGIRFDEVHFIMERGLDYINGLVNFTQSIHARNQPLNSICLPDESNISFRSFVGMSMLNSYLHATGTIPSEIITITSQPLSSENIKIYLTLSLLLRKKIKGQTKARMQIYSGNQEAVMASPLSLLIDLFSLSCSILMLHETMCNQGLYQSSNTDQIQYTSVMFQYADQMKDIISQIPTESIDVSYMYLGILYLLVMYFKQLEEIENQAISKGFSLHNNDIFNKQLASLSIVHKFVAVITNKYPIVMEKYKGTVERIGLFLNKYQIMNYQ